MKANDLSAVQDITLIHLSSMNSNKAAFRARAEAELGIPTYIAEPGLVVNMTKNYGY